MHKKEYAKEEIKQTVEKSISTIGEVCDEARGRSILIASFHCRIPDKISGV